MKTNGQGVKGVVAGGGGDDDGCGSQTSLAARRFCLGGGAKKLYLRTIIALVSSVVQCLLVCLTLPPAAAVEVQRPTRLAFQSDCIRQTATMPILRGGGGGGSSRCCATVESPTTTTPGTGVSSFAWEVPVEAGKSPTPSTNLSPQDAMHDLLSTAALEESMSVTFINLDDIDMEGQHAWHAFMHKPQHRQHPKTDHYKLEQHPHFQRVEVSDMALALRWTSEVNRRLQTAVSKLVPTKPIAVTEPSPPPPPPPPPLPREIFRSTSSTRLRGGSATKVVVPLPPSSPPPPPVFRIPWHQRQCRFATADDMAMEALTIFHAVAPVPGASGRTRWGPDLQSHLAHAVQRLRATDLERTLALLYLDRATTTTTTTTATTSDGGAGAVPLSPPDAAPTAVRPLPHCTPRTVHALVTTALRVAVAAVRGYDDDDDDVDNDGMHWDEDNDDNGLVVRYTYDTDAMDEDTLTRRRVAWMRRALGDDGIYVTPEQLRHWRLTWAANFCGTNNNRSEQY